MAVIRIDIVSDTVCPWCFIGKRRLERAMDAAPDTMEFDIRWHPFQLNPELPSEGMDKMEAYRRKFGAAQLERIIPHMKRTGLAEGIRFSYGGRIGNTLDSHRLLSWSEGFGRQNELAERLMRGYFEQEQCISDHGFLTDAAAQAGLPREEAAGLLASDERKDEVKSEITAVQKRGVTGVPNFTLNRSLELQGAQEPEAFLRLFREFAESP